MSSETITREISRFASQSSGRGVVLTTQALFLLSIREKSAVFPLRSSTPIGSPISSVQILTAAALTMRRSHHRGSCAGALYGNGLFEMLRAEGMQTVSRGQFACAAFSFVGLECRPSQSFTKC